MPRRSPAKPAPNHASDPPCDDAKLLRAAAGGDSAALRTLMDRYDRLVRFTIFKTARNLCIRDPDWLDTVAADTWTGLLGSSAADSKRPPHSMASYLASVARFRTISALRHHKQATPVALRAPGGIEPPEPPGTLEDDPGRLLAKVESLERLRNRIADLAKSDKLLLVQLDTILSRRWVEAATALGISESTLRSRWKALLRRLKVAMESETERDLAPEGGTSDLL